MTEPATTTRRTRNELIPWAQLAGGLYVTAIVAYVVGRGAGMTDVPSENTALAIALLAGAIGVIVMLFYPLLGATINLLSILVFDILAFMFVEQWSGPMFPLLALPGIVMLIGHFRMRGRLKKITTT